VFPQDAIWDDIFIIRLCDSIYFILIFNSGSKILGINCREKNGHAGEEFSHIFLPFLLLSIHGEPTKVEGGGTWCSNSRMKDDG
jgi:hypothetical protein